MIPSFQDVLNYLVLPKPRFYSDDGIRVIVPSSSSSPAIVRMAQRLYRNDSDVQFHSSTQGIGGLDYGSIAADTVYYLYAVPDGTAFSVIGSTNNPDTGPSNAGELWSYLGAFRTVTAGVIPKCSSRNGFYLRTDGWLESQSSTSTSPDAKTYTVPTTSRTLYGRVVATNSAAVGVAQVAGTSTSGDECLATTVDPTVSHYGYGFVDTPTTGTVYLRVSNAGPTCYFELFGWLETPSEYP